MIDRPPERLAGARHLPVCSVVGGGLAGCEAAWQLAERGVPVRLFEMRPLVMSPAHTTDRLAEVVCSNSFGAEGETAAAGILKAELAILRSLVLECAHASRVPAGGALAVDRERFSTLVTERILGHPNIARSPRGPRSSPPVP